MYESSFKYLISKLNNNEKQDEMYCSQECEKKAKEYINKMNKLGNKNIVSEVLQHYYNQGYIKGLESHSNNK